MPVTRIAITSRLSRCYAARPMESAGKRRLMIVIAGWLFTLVACGPAAPTRRAVQSLVTIERSGPAKARVVVLTQAVAVKETGPAETVKAFGEVYAFVPQTIVVRCNEPTEITFWNLQPDDEHDFMLTGPDGRVLLETKLEPLTKTTYVMTFHHEGLFPFYCTVHQPEMSGEILVTGPRQAPASRRDAAK